MTFNFMYGVPDYCLEQIIPVGPSQGSDPGIPYYHYHHHANTGTSTDTGLHLPSITTHEYINVDKYLASVIHTRNPVL